MGEKNLLAVIKDETKDVHLLHLLWFETLDS